MKAERFLTSSRERNWGPMLCRFDTAEARAELALAKGLVRAEVTGFGDYKDGAAALSSALFDTLPERQCPFAEPAKSALKLAQRAGLLEGGNCPRATLKAWSC